MKMIRGLFVGVTIVCLAAAVASTSNCKRRYVANIEDRCRSCYPGWDGDHCQRKNVALYGQAFSSPVNNDTYPAGLVVDGKMESCFQSPKEDNNPWWEVKLANNGVTQIKYMNIYFNRYSIKKEGTKMTISVGGQMCKQWKAHTHNETMKNVACNSTLGGQTLRIEQQGPSLHLCEVMVFVCSDGWFGEDCTSRCKCHHTNDTCDKVTGECKLGCKTGYTGVDCSAECGDGKYGQNCGSDCGHCLNGAICNKTSGICPGDCENGWRNDKCHQECEDGKYGKDCGSDCGHCLNGAICNKTSGICPGNCENGWRNDKCDQECEDGQYGKDCGSDCGHCLNGAICNKTSGICPGDCENGWRNDKCDQECEDGKYGKDCGYDCGHCLNGAFCNKTTGLCPGDCEIGWRNDKCDQECGDGKYGQNCGSDCGHCLNGAICNKTSGICPGDCENGWRNVKCHQECEDGKYGKDCGSDCGHCLNGAICNKTSGICPGDCENGWRNVKCDQECEDGKYGKDCGSDCGHCLNGAFCNKTIGICPGDCESGWRNDKCDQAIECLDDIFPFKNWTLLIPVTMVGKTFRTKEICFEDGNPLGEITCFDDGQGGAFWETFRLNPACNFSCLPGSEVSNSVLDLLLDDINKTNIESVLEKTHNITTDRNLTVLDVLYTTNILEKTTQLQDVSPEVVMDILMLYDTVSEFTSESGWGSFEPEAVGNRVVKVLDTVTGNMKPGPKGRSKIERKTFESEVWDLRNKHVTELPVGLTLTNETKYSSTLYSARVDLSETDSAIALSHEFLQDLVAETQGDSIRLSMNLYRNPLLFVRSKRFHLISKVISMKILVDGQSVTDLRGANVAYIFKTRKMMTSAKRVCGYWNFTSGSWSTDGCHHTGSEAGRDVCVCDHLTNFAVLLTTIPRGIPPLPRFDFEDSTHVKDFDGNSEESSHHLPLTVITMVGLILSIAGLSVTIASYLIFRRKLLKKHPQQTLFHLSLSQLCAWTVFLTGFKQTQSYVGCIMVAALLHYFIMASFLWMLAEAVLHYLLLVKVYTAGAITPHYMWKSGVPAWGLPMLPVTILLAIDVDLYRGRESHCWMSWTTSLYAFAIPIYIIVLCNLVFYLMIIHSMCKQRKVGQKNTEHKRNMLNARISFFCFVLFGLSWVFGFLAVAEAKVIFQYIFCVTASTQGFLIFLFFTARNQEVRQSWTNLCCKKTDRGILKMELVPQRKGGGASGTSVGTIETSVYSDTSA